MKKHLGLMTLGVTALLAIPVVGNAATFDPVVTGGSTGTSKATIEMTDDVDSMLQLKSAPDVNFPKQFTDNRARVGLEASTVKDPLSVKNPTSDGWQVQVAATDFMTSDSKVLTGAQMTFGGGTVDNGGTPVVPGSPAAQKVTVNSTPATVFASDDASKVGGDWNVTYKPADVSLDIPQAAVAGTYSADLTWTIGNTPS
ncbi:WxL domain-containing protein [Lactiplantibacillus nangangensis]|uniref:WxL domain-containing protein n=1 Tax=Lactiplantibacillus nangangensis TaxID=2559917 RepID=A0ABW1SFW8_9LACO|nr:WxL domain-containing protein [Lactiplantibacillus nangangensis]